MNRSLCIGAALSAACALPAAARPEVPIGAFSGAATRINFDNLMGGSTITTGEIIDNQYAALGVRFTNPDLLTRANANLATFFSTQSDPNIAFVDQGGGSTPGIRPQEIAFSTPQLRVGAWFGTSSNSTIKMQVYNGTTLLEELVKSGQPLGAFGLEGFIGLERSEGITLVRLSSASNVPGLGPFNFSFDDLVFEAGSAPCYANCDGSTTPPTLTVNDFICFQGRFAAGDSYANCDGSTTVPMLTVNDFICFQGRFAAGCSAP